ncbi:MAG: hypothetical protein GXO88_06185 [Chlorobi bacterium]|nr:hypothetical protein [Chlorobiota bacterium]
MAESADTSAFQIVQRFKVVQKFKGSSRWFYVVACVLVGDHVPLRDCSQINTERLSLKLLVPGLETFYYNSEHHSF